MHSVACKECVATQAYQPSLLQSESHSIAPQKITPCVRQARLTRCFTFLIHFHSFQRSFLPPTQTARSSGQAMATAAVWMRLKHDDDHGD